MPFSPFHNLIRFSDSCLSQSIFAFGMASVSTNSSNAENDEDQPIASSLSRMGTTKSFYITGQVDPDELVAQLRLAPKHREEMSPFVVALMQCHRLHRWATPSIIPGLILPSAMDMEFSISVSAFGSHLSNTGLLGDVAVRAARIKGADGCYYSVSGTTASNHKIMNMISNVFPGKPVLCGRNIHHSITYSSEMFDIPLSFLQPGGYITRFEAILPPTPALVEAGILEHPEAPVVLITSPTYEGVIADIEGIAEVTRKQKKILWVDQAWGSHLGLHEQVPKSALQCGADIQTESTHKTGGALQGASLLLFKLNERISEEVALGIRDAHQEEETTSPNFEIIASIDASLHRLSRDPKPLQHVVDTIRRLKGEISVAEMPHVDFMELTEELSSQKFQLDPVRLNIALPEGVNGQKVSAWLERHGVVAEKSGLHTLLFIATFQLPTSAPIRLANRLIEYFNKNPLTDSPTTTPTTAHSESAPEWLMNPSRKEAVPPFRYRPRIVKRADAIGQVANETIECYPPGIPVIICGYIISAEEVEYLEKMNEAGAHLTATDKTFDTIRIRLPVEAASFGGAASPLST
jgi:arginine decarboxylase